MGKRTRITEARARAFPEIARELLHQRVGVALHLAPDVRVELRRRAERVRIGMGNPVLHVLAEAGKLIVAEDVETRHHVDEVADVLDHRVAEDERLAVLALLQAFRDPLDGFAEAPVEVAHGIVQPFLDLAFDVALDPRGIVGGEPRHEVVGVRHRDDAIADRELALQRLLRGIVLDAEELVRGRAGPGRCCLRSPR